mgnify:CR=1 FL=1
MSEELGYAKEHRARLGRWKMMEMVDEDGDEPIIEEPVIEQLRVPDKVMLAHYPPGAKYVRHSDVSPAVSHRRVTAILYLNEGWEESHGGELQLYLPAGGGGKLYTASYISADS